MTKSLIQEINRCIKLLSVEQQQAIFDDIRKKVLGTGSVEAKECPCCKETNFMKYGNYKGTQKYMCKKTSRVFSYKSRLAIAGISKVDKIEQFIESITKNGFYFLDDMQKEFNISRPTAINWRNKVLTALFKKKEFNNEILEFDEKNFRLSCKGRRNMKYARKRGKKLVGDNKMNVKVFMAWSRTSKTIELYQSHMGRTKSQNVANYLDQYKDIVIYSDRHQAYKKYCKKRGIAHKDFLSSDHVSKEDRTVHNQTINYHSGGLERFLNDDLRGVTTKYLQGYLNWYMYFENVIKKNGGTIKDAVLENEVALDIFKQKEKEFQYFLRNNKRNSYGTYNDKYYN